METNVLTSGKSPDLQQPIATKEELLQARRQLLAREKALTKIQDQLNAERRRLPWVRIEKNYQFEGPTGKLSFEDLFAGKHQLVVYHFMFGPGWKEGCVGCSFSADHFDNTVVHLRQKDTAFVSISRAPIDEIIPFKQRMKWSFPWVSSFGSDFNADFQVSFPNDDILKQNVFYNFEESEYMGEERSGISVFYKNDSGDIFHTYSTYGRGGELMLGTYHLLDLTPKGRDENGPNGNLSDWVRHHDQYNAAGMVDNYGRYHAEENLSTCCHGEGKS